MFEPKPSLGSSEDVPNGTAVSLRWFVCHADELLEKYFWPLSLISVAICVGVSIVQDWRMYLWIDEIFTLYVAKLPSPAAIVTALLEGADGQPPLYHIVVHYLLLVLPNDALAIRLPSTFGYWAMVVCLLVYCRKRFSASFAFGAAFLPTLRTFYYATEGRSYGVVLGCAAGALLSWQIAGEGRKRPVALAALATTSGLMVAMHYFALFFLGPLFLGEMMRSWQRKKLDWNILAAIVLPALLVLFVHYPLIVANRPFMVHFWSTANLGQVPSFYSDIFPPLKEITLLSFAGLAFGRSTERGRSFRQSIPSMPLHEWVSAAAYILMPLLVIVLATFTTHAFVDRYILWTGIGISVLIAALLQKAARENLAVGIIFVCLVMGPVALQDARSLHQTPRLREGGLVNQVLQTMLNKPGPIIIPDGHAFVELTYYQPALRERLVYLMNRDLAVRFRQGDTLELIFTALRHYVPLRAEEYDDFLQRNPSFWLIGHPETYDYILRDLRARGLRVTPDSSSYMLFQVEK